MSVLLKGRNGNEVELSFVREALAEAQDGFGDDTWCMVIIRAANGDDTWEEAAPCVNFFEFQNLAEWLEAVGNAVDAAGSPEVSEIELLEPELRFTVARHNREGVGIRVAFHLDERPEEFEVDVETEEAPYVDVFVDRPAILAAAASLRAALEDIQTPAAGGKDDLLGEETPGIMGKPDDDLNFIDDESEDPPGAGFGEDNAGNR